MNQGDSNKQKKVIANKAMSDEDVLSAVPQGTPLTSVLFIVMISNIVE